jgi:hypothetical protein
MRKGLLILFFFLASIVEASHYMDYVIFKQDTFYQGYFDDSIVPQSKDGIYLKPVFKNRLFGTTQEEFFEVVKKDLYPNAHEFISISSNGDSCFIEVDSSTISSIDPNRFHNEMLATLTQSSLCNVVLIEVLGERGTALTVKDLTAPYFTLVNDSVSRKEETVKEKRKVDEIGKIQPLEIILLTFAAVFALTTLYLALKSKR